jgi:hypothetical protein
MPQNFAQEFARVREAEAVAQFKEQEQRDVLLASKQSAHERPADAAPPCDIGLAATA